MTSSREYLSDEGIVQVASDIPQPQEGGVRPPGQIFQSKKIIYKKAYLLADNF